LYFISDFKEEEEEEEEKTRGITYVTV
jgi:hypothetical protein